MVVGVNVLENINLKDFPQESGVYWFINEDDEIIYVGSAKNIYGRMRGHRASIKRGYNGNKGKGQKELYQFLQQNNFKVQFQITEKYHDLEKQLIEKYLPIFNEKVLLFSKEAKKKREKSLKYKQRHIKYVNKLCNYNGEIIKLGALAFRFYRAGIPHYWSEAGKYLI